MSKSEFKAGQRVEVDDLLKHEAQLRQQAKANPVALNETQELVKFIHDKLSLQKVSIKPLALEQLSNELIAYFKPKKKAAKKA